MKKTTLFVLLSVLVLVSMIAAQCGQPPAPATQEAPATEAAVEEEAVVEEEAAPAEEAEPAAGPPEDEWGVVEVAAGDPVRIGFAAALSGAGVDVLGIDEQRGAELAVGDRPEIMGHEVELVVEDSLCSGEGGTAVANKFVADDTIAAVVGHMCSSSSIAASDIYEKAHYTMVSPSSTAVAFTARGQAATNRVCWSDAIQGPAAAEFAYNELGARRLATIHDGSPYGEGLVNAMGDAFEALGGEVVAREAVAVGDTDMRPVLTKIGAEDPEMIYWGAFVAEGAYLATQRADVGLEDVIFMGADGIKAEDFITAAGDAAEGVYASAADFGAAGPGLQEFLDEYVEVYGEEPPAPFHAHAYDAVNVILNAVDEVGVKDADGNLYIGRKALNEAIRGTEGMQGLTGIITCDDKGDCGTGTVAIFKVEGGEFVTVSGAGSEAAAAGADLGTVKIGTNAEYPPFEFVDDAGEIVGFDIDLVKAIAEAGGFDYEMINTRWDGIFVALASGEFDGVASAATITEERKETVDFSDPYFNAGQVLAVKIGSDITGVDQLEGKRVGVQLGTTGDIWSTDNTQAEVVRYDEITLAFQALAQGDVDAVINDLPVSADIIKANPEMEVEIIGDALTDEFYGIAVNKDRPEVLAAINEGLAAIKASGVYDEIYVKWFGAGEAAVTEMDEECAYGGEIKSVEAVDDLTVKISLCYPDVAFLSKAAFTAFSIHPSEQIEAEGGSGALLDAPIGTGPYYLAEWNRGDSMVFKRFEDYWGDPAKTETVVFRWSAESAQRALELQAGTVDGIDNPAPDDFEVLSADPTLALYPREGMNIFYLGMNNTYPPFDDEKVRQAIAMGIDRDRIVDTFYPPGSEVASHFTPCSIPGGCVGEDWYEFDPDAARALLAEAGYPDGFDTTISYRDVVRSYLPEPGIVAQDLQAQLKENLGINAEIVMMESGAFLDAADSGMIDGFHMLGWGADYPDQTNFLDYHFGSGASPQFGDGFPDIWEKLQAGASVADQDARDALYAEANDLIKQHAPMVPVAHGGSATVFKADVEGAHSSPLGNEYFAVMELPGQDTLVWSQNAEPISLYCNDETDGESFRGCEQILESLLGYEVGGTAVEPRLAESWTVSDDLMEWTFNLRPDVKWHDGSDFDAQDVVVSYEAMLDAANPNHTGNTGGFVYWSALFGGFKNAPAE
jgi:peptide/nickel transport system substrate-binding protein